MHIEHKTINYNTDLALEVLQKLFLNFSFVSCMIAIIFNLLNMKGVNVLVEYFTHSIQIWSLLVCVQVLLDIQNWANNKFFGVKS